VRSIVNLFIFILIVWPTPSLFSQSGSDVSLEKGTHLVLRLNEHLSTKLSREGDEFTGSVITPVTAADRILLPTGTLVTGRVSRIQRPGRFRGKAMMNLIFESIRLPDGRAVPIMASLVRVDLEGKGSAGDEGTVTAGSSAGRDAGTVAKPGLAGAGIGAIIGGGKGSAVGAGVGAAVGLATVFATRGKDLEVRRGATMEIVLDRLVNLHHEAEPRSIRQR